MNDLRAAHASEDAKRLDWLESTVRNEGGELNIHDDLESRNCLGLTIQNRSLREAIDVAMQRAAHARENQTKWRHCPTCGSLVPRDVVSAAQSSEPWWYEITADGDWIIGSGSRGFALVNDESQAQIIVDRHNSRATHISNQLADFQVGCEKAYQKGRKDREREIYGLKDRPAHASEALPLQHDDRAAAIVRREELIGVIVGDLVRETNIFPSQVTRAKELIRERLSGKQ